MSLHQFQKSFLKNVKESDPWIEDQITPGGTLTIQGALDVYRGDYYARLTEAIGESFESIWFVLGDDDFLSLAHKYIEAHPSDVRDLGSYAKNFPDYIGTTSYHDEFPFLVDLAKFEQHFWNLFHAEPVKRYDPFADLKPESLGPTRWSLPNKAHLACYDFDIPLIFASREGVAEETEIDYEQGSAVLMCKLDQNVRILKLTPNQYLILMNLQDGQTLEESLVGSADEIQSLFALLKGEGIPLRRRIEGAS